MTIKNEDAEYLKNAVSDASEDEIEEFCECVAKMWADGIRQHDARLMALQQILDNRK